MKFNLLISIKTLTIPCVKRKNSARELLAMGLACQCLKKLLYQWQPQHKNIRWSIGHGLTHKISSFKLHIHWCSNDFSFALPSLIENRFNKLQPLSAHSALQQKVIWNFGPTPCTLANNFKQVNIVSNNSNRTAVPLQVTSKLILFLFSFVSLS